MSCINSTTANVLNNDQIIATTAANEHLSEVPTIPPAKLKAKPKDCEGVWSLPFTAIEPEDVNKPEFWVVPAAGGCTGGRQAGKAMAYSYLKYLKGCDNGDDFLPFIASSLSSRIESAGGQSMAMLDPALQSNEYVSLISQGYGFFETLGGYLKGALVNDRGFDCLDNDDFIAMANEGLSYASN